MTQGTPMQLEEFYVTRLELAMPENLKSGKSRDGEVCFDYEVSKGLKNPLRYRLVFHVKVDPPFESGEAKDPSLNATIIGFFTFPEETEPTKREFLIRYNGGTMLYGLLRGQVAAFSGAFPTGKLMLPSVNMAEVVATIERKRQAAATPAKKRAREKRTRGGE